MSRRIDPSPNAATLQEFRYVGETPLVFSALQLPSGSTLLGEPGATYVLDAATSHPLLVPAASTSTEPDPTPADDESAAS